MDSLFLPAVLDGRILRLVLLVTFNVIILLSLSPMELLIFQDIRLFPILTNSVANTSFIFSRSTFVLCFFHERFLRLNI